MARNRGHPYGYLRETAHGPCNKFAIFDGKSILISRCHAGRKLLEYLALQKQRSIRNGKNLIHR